MVEFSAAMQAHEIFHLVVVAGLLLAVEPRGLCSVAHRAVRRPAVAETAAKEGTG